MTYSSSSSSIKMEKAEAMMRYRRLRNVANTWRILEVSVALLLVSRWLPSAAKIGVHCLLQATEYLYSPHINFVIGNAIIVVLVLLSRRRNSTGSSGLDISSGGAVDFGIDEFVQSTEAHLRIVAPATVPVPVPDFGPQALAISPAAEETAVVEKRIVVPENAGGDSVIIPALEEAKEQLGRFQRTQSEKLRRDLRVKPRRELLRSESETKPRSSAVNSGKKKSRSADLSPVDTLSSDEFRKTIDDFIERHRRSLSEQKVTGVN